MDKVTEIRLWQRDPDFRQMFCLLEESDRQVNTLVKHKQEIERNLSNPKFIAMMYGDSAVKADLWYLKLDRVKKLVVSARHRRSKRQKRYDVTYRMIKDYEGVASIQ